MSQTASWAERIREELVGNILPFWMRYAVDRQNGGFYGAIDENLNVEKESERSAVVNTRILWTFAAASRLIGREYRETADWAYDYITNKFLDPEKGGLFWMVDYQGNPVSTRKQIYAQAFGIYALAEYFRATGNAASLDLARRLFRLIEEHSYDPVFKGYLEARGRDWQALEDMRLSEKDLNSPKSMNTHLHVLEAYTNLLRVWRDPALEAKQTELLTLTQDRIVDASTGHFKLFFDERWNSLSNHVSYGHDIEGSWLIVEAAEVLGDAGLIERARKLAITMAETVYQQGLDRDGSLFYEADAQGALIDSKKHWWAQAEAVVGFYNAFQISGEEHFLAAARRAWDYIEAKVVDRVHGEWHAKLSREGVPLTAEQDPDAQLVGPWKCPYHNARVCYEMIERLEKQTNGKQTP
ncbi:MAG: AGE family epimerase/isomerase [Rhizomicrobium sp.]|jgi:mannobiose 2-epimerase